MRVCIGQDKVDVDKERMDTIPESTRGKSHNRPIPDFPLTRYFRRAQIALAAFSLSAG